MRTEERLNTIYEVLAPQIVRSEHNWRDYLSFGSRFHKHSFDNMLLVYGQNPNVSMLATTKQWNDAGRYVNRGAKGMAVCVYEKSKITLSYLFDISQTNGRAVNPTDWKLSDGMKAELVSRLSYAHGYEIQDFSELLYALAAEATADNFDHYLQGVGEDIKGHLFSELPTGGFEAQFQELLADSVSYFIGKRCALPDEAIRTGDGMSTISHFNTIPLIARAGSAVTALSKGILLEMERTIRIINRERKEQHEQQANDRAAVHRERRDSVSEHSGVQRQRGRSAPGQVRPDGLRVPDGEPPRPLYDFENGWQPHGSHAPGTGGSDGENRSPDPAASPRRPPAADRGHDGADEASEQPQAPGGGTGGERTGADSEIITPPQENTAQPGTSGKEPSEKDGSFFVPFSPDVAARWRNDTVIDVLPLPALCGLPSKEKAADMAEWLKKHGSRFDLTYTVLYHATSRDVPVLTEGLLPTGGGRRNFQQSRNGYVCLASTPEQAKGFGDMGTNSDSVVYEVLVPVFKLAPDADQLNALRDAGTEVGRGLAESIVYGGGARVRGAIEQWQIKPFDYDGYIAYKAAQEHPDPSAMSDEEVRRHYEFILTSTELYPSELHRAMRELLAEPPTDYDWRQKAPGVRALFRAYGNREYQGEVLYRTVLRGDDGISLYFGDGYTYLPWMTVANIVDAMIEDGDYPMPRAEEQEPDPIGDFNIPDELEDMGNHSDGNTNFDRVLAVVSEYERLDGQTPAATLTPIEGIPKFGEDDTAVQVTGGGRQLGLYEAKPSGEGEKPEKQRLPSDAPHRNYRAMKKLFPQVISGEYRYLRLESEGYMPLSLEWVYKNQVSIMHTFIQNGDLMRDPDVVVRVDREEKTVQAVSFQQDGGPPIYQEVMDYEGRVIDPRGQKDINSFLTGWLSNIREQEYAPARAVFLENGEDKDITFPKEQPQAEAPEPAAEPEMEPEQLPLDIKTQPEPPIRLKAADPMQFVGEVTGAHHGQLDVRMQAVIDELTVGVLEYSVFEDVPHIAMIEVLEGYRRQGIATGMMQKLQGEYPNTEIAWGMLTDDGAKFKAAVTYTVFNEQFERGSDDLDEISEKLLAYENDLNSGKILSPRQANDMDELSDIQYRLERELQELEPIKTFVRLPGEEQPEPEKAPGEKKAPDEDNDKDEELEADGQELPYDPQPPVPPVGLAQEGPNFRYSPAYGLYPPGAKTKFRNNIEAIRFLKRIEKERRPATPEEQIVLARYVGWGGLANAFSDKAAGWEKEYRELKMLLNDVEYRNALHSTLTAYYTEPELVSRIYAAIGSFGFPGGSDRKMLDPAMGTGNFYSVLPEGMRGTKLYGVEIDSITGRIAKQLYPEANIAVAGYQSAWFEPESFDVILGNIPFNNIKVRDKKYEEHSEWRIHDYFFGKSLDLLKPGGVLAFITSQGTMDKMDDSVRRYIAQRAELIGAVRLPNTAFKALAGTEVTTDILFLKKRGYMVQVTDAEEFDWLYTGTDRNRGWIRYNDYYQEHPEMVLGEMRRCTNQYGKEDAAACIAPAGYDLYAELDRAIGSLQAKFTAEPDPPYEEPETNEIEIIYEDAPAGTRNYTFVVRDEEIFYCEKNKLIPQPFTGKRAERIRGLCGVRAALLEVIGIQSREYDPADLKQVQEKLNEVYDRFVKKNDAINCLGNILAFSDDDQFPLLRSIEDERKDKSGWDKAAIFTQATIHPYRVPSHVDTALEAMQISMNQKLRLDFPYMSGLTGKQPNELIAELGGRIYLNPHRYYGNSLEGWELAEEYLSGFVRDKLLYARQKAEEYPELFTRNVEALEAAQPAPLTPADIEVVIGAPWIPIPFYRQFLYETFGTDEGLRVSEDGVYDEKRIDIDYVECTTAWRISSKFSEKDSVKVNQTFGTGRKNAYEIFEDCLNMQSTTVRDPEPYVNKKGKDSVRYVVNPQETMIARAKQNQIREAFSTWLWREPQRRDALLKIYNERFNVVRPREYDGSHLVFPGMNTEMKLRKHQLDFAARVIYSGTGLAAHEVGAGKTAAMIAAGMYLKTLGAIQKPVFTVPNQLVGQWAAEFYRFYPNARLLVSTEDDFTPKNRNRYIARIATGDYDAVLLAHSQFEKVPISEERQIAQLQKQIDELSFAIYAMKEEKGENWSVKQMAMFQDNLQVRLERLSAEEKKDDLLTFEQLGVDMMFVDEAHFFKNCFVYTKLRNVAGIGQASSQRAFDMLLKCQYLQEVNDGRGVVFATGTPISNSLSEMFVMQRYLQPQELENLGLTYFDSWAATFAERVSSLEITPEGGGYRMRDRFAKFHNLPELMAVFNLVADIKTADMLDLKRPAIHGGKAKVVPTQATPFQKKIMADFVTRAERIRKKEVEPEVDNMLKLTSEARLMAIDPRLLYPDAPNEPESKLNVCINSVYDIWEITAQRHSTQLIFCDSGTPKPGKFNVYDEMKRVLLEKGVPENEIAFIQDASTDAQRQALFEKTRNGEIRILIGSTSKLGTGVNVQDKIISLNHLDCPWKPSDITQRDGRGVRFGNENDEVYIRQFVTVGTFDSYLWQIQEQKLRYIMQILTGKSIARSCEDVDELVLNAAQVKAVATDNPMLSEKMGLENRITELKILRGSWQNEQLALDRNISDAFPRHIAAHQKNIGEIKKDIALLEQTEGRDFSIVIEGRGYEERTQAGEAFLRAGRMSWQEKPTHDPIPIGTFRGLDLLYQQDGFNQCYFILRGSHSYRGELGSSDVGAIARLERAAGRIGRLLASEQHELENFQGQLAEAKRQFGQPFLYEQELSDKVARLTEINVKLEFQSLQDEEALLTKDGQERTDGENQAGERLPACVGAEL